MTPPGVMMELPTLFDLGGGPPLGHSLDDLVLAMLAEPARSVCVVCEGTLEQVPGGVRCVDCGSQILVGAEPTPAWVPEL
jgi:DNA-directed RNA polymerase subunit RPC12/RpoP